MFTRKTGARMLSLTAGAVALALGVSTVADAVPQTVQGTINVSAHVDAACSMTTHDLGFGTYDPLGANKTQDLFTEADISVTCTKDAATTISLSSGGHAAGGTRQLTDGAATPHFLTYSLYSDPTRTAAWGDGTLAAVLSYAGTGASDTVKVYGKIEKNQLAAPGDFTDTVTATITF